MKCPKCRADNPDQSRFCGHCATELAGRGRPRPELTKTLESPVRTLSKGSLVAGKYRIIDEIGRGGMGVVYQAEDTTLARSVAIKVLPEGFTGDPERLARFEREAKLLALLNHPHVATIFGLEESEGRRFLVMELVEGETLAERIDRGPLTLEEVVEVCLQVADGVEAAHEKGIIHRDLKPANVKLTPGGKVKVLDFGLAKAHVSETSGIDIEKSPTITGQMTEPGVILGTAAYMSPEQAKGRTVDKRTDIWAFGCILFECLTGKRAFTGESVSDTMAAVLRGEPDWDSLPSDTPGNVRAVLLRCLQKDPGKRLRDIGDARLEIAAPIPYPTDAATAPRRFPLPWLAAGMSVTLLAGILIGTALTRKGRPAPSPPVSTSTIKIEPGHWLDGMRGVNTMARPSRTAIVISSDGRFVVYGAIQENSGAQAASQLYLRRLDQADAKPIAGTEGGVSPFLSPDNRWVGYLSCPEGKLKKVSVEGGVPNTLCDASIFFWGANWGPDNSIVFAAGSSTGLSKVSAEGGKPEILTIPDPKREERSHRLPSCLPRGKAVLFTVMRHGYDRQPQLALLRLDTREWRVLLQNAADARYVPTGHLVFLRQGTLMAVRFDLATMEVVGQPVELVENVMQAFHLDALHHTGAGQFAISDTGSLIYAAGGVAPDPKASLVWVDQRGAEQPVTELQFPFFAPRLSPDGRRIAYTSLGREWQVYVYDLTRGTNSPITREGMAIRPIWAPDGQRLLFGWKKSLSFNLFWQPYDGSSPMERLTTEGVSEQWPGSWSSDGHAVAFVASQTGTANTDIAVLDVPSRRVTPFLNSASDEQHPEFSPDGRWIAYTSNESTRDEVYVRAFPGPGIKAQVSGEGGDEPLWARDGKKIFYRYRDGLWVVDVRTDGGFAATKPRRLFEKPGYSSGVPIRAYDLSLDSERFLMVKEEPRKPSPATEMVLVQNWFDELKRLVPTGKK